LRGLRRRVRAVHHCLGAAARIAAIVLWLAATTAAAQEAAAPVSAEPPAERPAGPADEFERGTPRSSVHHYLVACREGDFERAANHLQLGSVPKEQRAAKGPELARRLKAVLDRELWVETERLSDAPEGYLDDGLPPDQDFVGSIQSGEGRVDILVDRVPRGNGSDIWKFSSQTVRLIPALYDEFGFGRLGEWLPPIFFESYFLEVQLWQWLGLMAVIFVAFAMSWFVARAVITVVRPAVARSSTEVDDRVLHAVIGPLRILAGALLFYTALPFLVLSVPAQKFFLNATKVGTVLAATWFVLRLIDVFSDVAEAKLEARGERESTALIPLGRKTIKVFVMALALLAALDSFGFDVTALIAGLGVGGLAVALAAQKTLENLFGGATLIADRPVQVGDFCRFGDKVGTVEEIGMRSTRVRTLERTIVTIPNAEFSSMQLENFGERDKMKFSPGLGLLYATTPDQLRFVLVEIRRMLYAHPKVLNDPARVRFVGFGDSSLDVEIFAYVDATDFSEYLGVAEDLNLRIMDIVSDSGTGFAFPSNTTYLAQDEGIDAEKARRAEEAVRRWQEREELYLPGFPEEHVEALRETIEYPRRGAPPGVTK
jgi:MscS family membrane protein